MERIKYEAWPVEAVVFNSLKQQADRIGVGRIPQAVEEHLVNDADAEKDLVSRFFWNYLVNFHWVV